MTRSAVSMSVTQELDRQIQGLIASGYPIQSSVGSLLEKAAGIEDAIADIDEGILPFVVVVTSRLVPSEAMMSRVEKDGRSGVTKLFPHEPADFRTIASVRLPSADVYLLSGIDRGKSNINLPPDEALTRITAEGRSPLTIDEGIAVITHFPDCLFKNNCFSLAASRHPGDRRVPAIWINKARHPHLGWCWAGNPHTWLGTASCATRL